MAASILDRGSVSGPRRDPRLVNDTAETFDQFEVELEEVRECDDAALVFGRLSVRGRGSGATVDVSMAWVFRFVEDKVVWAKSYSDREEALAEAGLDE